MLQSFSNRKRNIRTLRNCTPSGPRTSRQISNIHWIKFYHFVQWSNGNVEADAGRKGGREAIVWHWLWQFNFMSISQWCWKLMLRQDGGSQLCTLDIGHHKLHLNSWMSSPQYLRVVRRNPPCQFLHMLSCWDNPGRGGLDIFDSYNHLLCGGAVVVVKYVQFTDHTSVFSSGSSRPGLERVCADTGRWGRGAVPMVELFVVCWGIIIIPSHHLSSRSHSHRAVHTTDSVMFIWIDKNDVWICVEYVNRYEYLNTM